MVRFDQRTGYLNSTDLGRTASHFYIKYDTIEVRNRQAGRQAGRQTDTKTDRQTDKQTDRQEKLKIVILTLLLGESQRTDVLAMLPSSGYKTDRQAGGQATRQKDRGAEE